MRAITTDPEHLARRLGVTVLEHRGGEKGRHHPGGIISLRRGLGPAARRVTLAHELGHYIHKDQPTHDPWLDARQERRADEFAAALLIDPDDYELAEKLVGHHPGALARELSVTTHLVHIWRGLYERSPQ